ncbi:hypothetical protein [Ktedonobacter robiniae]|uniref:Uncharacterized protein n=1 Tax=Ktedonobacter robiniae TaxID=2778365 RepID=A0ABQ3UPV8_9CHLR|nr:hypothetical protein [Ktedonobacter robiniae]GHO54632.1 hypothetical protein KSB_31070 [Ktedonobacter robiniae]
MISHGASTALHARCQTDVPVNVSNIAFFRGVQLGYQAYQNEHTPLSEHDLYERLIYRLLAFPNSTYENTGWIVGWVKGLLEDSASQQPPSASGDIHSEALASYADNFVPVIPSDHLLHSTSRPFCYDSSWQGHEDESNIALVAEYVTNGLMTPPGFMYLVGLPMSDWQAS